MPETVFKLSDITLDMEEVNFSSITFLFILFVLIFLYLELEQ